MARAFEEARREIEGRAMTTQAADVTVVRRILAIRIMAAVREGQRDPDQLRILALQAVQRSQND